MNFVTELIRALGRTGPDFSLTNESRPRPAVKIEKRLGTEVLEHRVEGGVQEEESTTFAALTRFRRLLRQVAYCSVPTYFLDPQLRVIDWNLAFEIVYQDVLPAIDGQHVKHFIVRLANHEEVLAHAQAYTAALLKTGVSPFLDTEWIDYRSPEFGLVRSFKVASRLIDSDGSEDGWAVSLWPREIDWDAFQTRLSRCINADKSRSIFAGLYDRVFLNYRPYADLVSEVIGVVPPTAATVVDLRAATGDVSRALAEKGHSVTALENNLDMLDHLSRKLANDELDQTRVKVIKSSTLHLDRLENESFDAAVLVNVMDLVGDSPLSLNEVHRILRPGGVLGTSMTHVNPDQGMLTDKIWSELIEAGNMTGPEANAFRDVRRLFESTRIQRPSQDELRSMILEAGFEITREIPSVFSGAMSVLHVRKQE